MGEFGMLTLLVGVRSTLADDLQAAADEVFGEALTLCPWNHLRVILLELEPACHDLSERRGPTLRSSTGAPPASFWQNECSNEFLFSPRIELGLPQITSRQWLGHNTGWVCHHSWSIVSNSLVGECFTRKIITCSFRGGWVVFEKAQ